MAQQYKNYDPCNDEAVMEELSLEVTNGSKPHEEYNAHQSQIDMVFNRFINGIKKNTSDLMG